MPRPCCYYVKLKSNLSIDIFYRHDSPLLNKRIKLTIIGTFTLLFRFFIRAHIVRAFKGIVNIYNHAIASV